MRYLIRNRLSLAIVRTIDRLLSLSPRLKIPLNAPKKILLANIASLGDVVIATAALPPLKRAFPEAKIGFLIASWARPLLQKHPLVDQLHSFDHAYINPQRLSKCKAALHHFKTAREAVREISLSNYDLAIDLHPFFPNAIPLLYRTNIPFLLGYESGGFSPLLTHPIPWGGDEEYMGYSPLRLLSHLGLDTTADSPLPFLPTPSTPPHHPGGIVLHMGSSSPLKDWPLGKWKQLISRLKPLGFPLLLTGKGARERELVEEVSKAYPDCINLCDQLSWEAFVSTLHHARLLISSDSVAVHVAAAQKIPTLVLFCGINSPAMWVPPHPNCTFLSHKVPCAPCHQKQGCRAMSCIRDLSVEKVIDQVGQFLQSAAPPLLQSQSSPSQRARGH